MTVVGRSLSLIIHGGSKVGKSTLASTAPAPRLILDAEGGTKFLPQVQVRWDPRTGPPPVYDGTWETCVVIVHDFESVRMAYQWLASGQHTFASVILDSISEIQQRCIDAIAGIDQMKQTDWGELLRTVALLARQFRDLCDHPTKPLEAVVMVAMSRDHNGKWRPWVQGALGTALPYYFDVIGALYIGVGPDGITPQRQLLVEPHPLYEAGQRVQGRIGPVEVNPTIPMLLDKIYGPIPAPAPA